MVKGFRDADQAAGKFTAKLGAAVRGTAALGAALGGAAVGSAVVTLRKMATEMDAISKRADRLNITTEALTALDFQAGQAGVSTEVLDRGLRNIQDRAVKAAGGSKELADGFRVLGLNAGEVAKLEPDVALGRVADALNDVENPAQRMATAMKLVGEEAGVKLATLMASGSEGIEQFRQRAETLGLTFSRQVGAQMEAFNDSLDIMRQLALGAARQFAINFAPVMQAFAQLIFDNEGAVADLRNAVAVDLANAVAKSVRFLLNLPNAIQGVFAEFAVSIAQMRVDIATSVQGMLGPLRALAGFIENTPGRWSPIGIALRKVRDDAVDLAGAQNDLAIATAAANEVAEATRPGGGFYSDYEAAAEAATKLGDRVRTALPAIKELETSLTGRDSPDGGGGRTIAERLAPPEPGPWDAFTQRIQNTRMQMQQLGVTATQAIGQGVGQAVGGVVAQMQTFGDAAKQITQTIASQLVGALVSFGVQAAIVALVGQQALAAVSAQTAATMGAVIGATSAGAASLAAAWAPSAIAASIATLGAAAGIGGAAYTAALTAGTAATIAAQATTAATGALFGAIGQAHSGLDNVPATGTYLLKQGEAVLQPEANRDLREYLGRGGGNVNVYNYGGASVRAERGPNGVDIIIDEVAKTFLRQSKTGRGKFARGARYFNRG
jgi:hypothetical protein